MGEKVTQEIVERLARIETKLDNALDKDKDHESRLRATERNQWFFSGIAAVIGSFLGGHFPKIGG